LSKELDYNIEYMDLLLEMYEAKLSDSLTVDLVERTLKAGKIVGISELEQAVIEKSIATRH